MAIPDTFKGRLRLPAIAAPMFLVSGPELVIASCASGVIGTFPALNRRTSEELREWIVAIKAALAEIPGAAPFGVNLIVHKTNPRVEADLDICVTQEVPLLITSLGAISELVARVHGYGGLVFHDITNMRHARKAAEAGVDGLIAVCAGAGGHAGTLSPFALVPEIREFFAGTIVLAGAISDGRSIAAATVLGADLAYLGTRFIATKESMAGGDFKNMILASAAADISYTAAFSGIPGSYLDAAIRAAGLDPDDLPDGQSADFGARLQDADAKPWKNIYSAGQGVGAISDVPGVAELVDRLAAEYEAARSRFIES